MKQISIVIATFNAAHTLERCLQSIISQKQEEIELLVIDGESTDGTLAIIEQYREQIDFFLSESDSGLYDAWNKGIRAAHGKWIWFIGADDCLVPKAIANYLEFLRLHIEELPDIDLITAEETLVDNTGRKIKTMGKPFCWKEYRKLMLIAHGATLHKKQLYVDYGLYSLDFKICADYEFLFRKGFSIRSLHMPLSTLLFATGGASDGIGAFKESFHIRKQYGTVSTFINVVIFCRQILSRLKRSVFHQ